MTPTTVPPLEPPRWPQVVLRYVLPCDPMRDSIFGDLHEEFVIDVARFGLSRARASYARRAAGIIAHAAFDSLLWRSWVSTTPPASAAQCSGAAHTEMRRLPIILARARAAGGGAGLGVLALGVLSVGIVANTVLFSTVRNAPRTTAAHQGSVLISTVGVGAVALAVACAGVAAVILCAGPRWLRRRSTR